MRPASALDLRDVAREIGLVFCVALVYYLVRGLVRGKPKVAVKNARSVAALERRLGLYVEPSIQRHTLRSALRVHAWNMIYFWGHLPLLATFGAWLYAVDRELYRRLRRVFLISQGFGALIYLLFPVAPPRLMPVEMGYVDTLADRHELHYQMGSMQLFLNEHAAMPSLHFGWSLLMAVGLWSGDEGWRRRAIGLASPLASAGSIVATANHWVLDAVAGGLVMAASFLVERLISSASGKADDSSPVGGQGDEHLGPDARAVEIAPSE